MPPQSTRALPANRRLMEPQNQDVGRKLFLFTVAMFTIPVIAFFIFRTHVFVAGASASTLWLIRWMGWAIGHG